MALYRLLGRHQLVVPKEAREALNLKAGDLVVSYVERGKLVTVPIKRVANPVQVLMVADKSIRKDAVKLVHEARER